MKVYKESPVLESSSNQTLLAMDIEAQNKSTATEQDAGNSNNQDQASRSSTRCKLDDFFSYWSWLLYLVVPWIVYLLCLILMDGRWLCEGGVGQYLSAAVPAVLVNIVITQFSDVAAIRQRLGLSDMATLQIIVILGVAADIGIGSFIIWNLETTCDWDPT